MRFSRAGSILCLFSSLLMAPAPISSAEAATTVERVQINQKSRKKPTPRKPPAAVRVDRTLTTAAIPAQPSPLSPYGWLITVNAKALVSPRWIGSSQYGFIAYPTMSFRRPGETQEWTSADDSISFAAFSGNGFNVGPVIAFRGGRYDANAPALRGVHNVGWTLEPGAFASVWVAPDALRARVEVRRGFRSEDGVVAALGVDWVTRWRDLTFAIGPRLNIADARFMRLRFGVTPTDNARNPAFAAYTPGGGLYSAGAYGSLTWRASEQLAFTAHGGWERLTGQAAASPIVRQAGARNQFTAGVTASYSFQLGQ